MTPTRCAEFAQKDSPGYVLEYVPEYVPEDASECVPEDASEVGVGGAAHSSMPQTNSSCGETR